MSAAEPLGRRLLAEGVGSAFLLATVVGSGIMGANLAGGNLALALLGNTLPTGAILVVLILIFGPISGAHMNPAVSLAFALRRELLWRDFASYVAVQIVGAVVGVGPLTSCSICRRGRFRPMCAPAPRNGFRKA